MPGARTTTRSRATRRPLFAAAVVALVAAGASRTSAAADPTGELLLPSSRCRGLFIVPVAFGGATLDFVLDTGAESSSIDPDSVRGAFGESPKAGKSITLRGGSIGPLRLDRIRARVHEMDHLRMAVGRPIDGILGMDLFTRHLLTLDYPGARVTVAEGGLPAPDGVEVFASLERKRPFIALDLAGRRVPLLVDSGFTGGLRLSAGDALAWDVAPRPTHAAVRYSGTTIQRTGRMSGSLRIGPLVVERPIIRLDEGHRILGADLLEHLVLTLDLRNRRVRLRPGTDGPILMEPVRGSGLALRPGPDGMEVIEVFADSPAARAGIRTGDRVVAIDGAPVAERGCVPMLEVGGKALSIERHGTRFEVTLEAVVVVP